METLEKKNNYYNPKIYYSIENVQDGWMGTFCMGSFYHETPIYQVKEDAISELSRFMFSIKRQIDNILNDFACEKGNTNGVDNKEEKVYLFDFLQANGASVRLLNIVRREIDKCANNEGEAQKKTVDEFVREYTRSDFRRFDGVGYGTLKELCGILGANKIQF